ncbi:preprotein translocase subunit YajC [Candidatus Babeliales bacterium]|nr:preprotein translocase subunit YajC [Candidatus Babeliales bacterium]
MITFLSSILQATSINPIAGKFPAKTTNIIGMFGQFLPFILIALIFYFFIIRPQSKQRQMLQQMIYNLKPGNRIITKGGIIGTIKNIQNNSFILELHDGTKIEILKSAVISMLNEQK